MGSMTHRFTRRDVVRLAAASGPMALAGLLVPSHAFAAVGVPVGTLRLTDAAWHARLAPEAYAVLRQAATERPFSRPLLGEHRRGTFDCAGCALPLFASITKFDSGTGWPSFWNHFPRAVSERSDDTLGFDRTEVRCARCDGHLGHVFQDGPRPTGLRYCMNGAALHFRPT